MKFSTRQDTDIPAEALFDAIGDFPVIERMLARRGASVTRLDDGDASGLGMRWLIGFDWRGRAREMRLEVTRSEAPEVLEIEGGSDQFDVRIRMTVVALTPSKSRLIFEAAVQPRGMKARLLLQTAKLGKGQLDRKFAQRIGEFVAQVVPGTAIA